MKICFLIPSMTGGGAERVTANLANQMDALGHEVTILMVAFDEVAYRLNEGIKVQPFGKASGGSLTGRIHKILALRKYFKKHKDTVFIAMATETNMFAALAAVGIRVSLIVSERSNPNEFPQKKLRDFAYTFVKKIVFQTGDARDCFPERLRKAGKIIPNPICETGIEKYTGKKSKRFVAVGRLQPVKNHNLMLEAFAMVAEKYTDYDLYIYGEGPLGDELRELCKQYGIEKRVHFEGFCEDVQSQIRDASAYLLSSNYEGISNSLLEAMAMGLTVISTDCPVGGSRMLIEHQKNGLLVPVGDVTAFAKAMETIITDEEAAVKMGDEATKVNEKYSIQTITEEWIDYIKQ